MLGWWGVAGSHCSRLWAGLTGSLPRTTRLSPASARRPAPRHLPLGWTSRGRPPRDHAVALAGDAARSAGPLGVRARGRGRWGRGAGGRRGAAVRPSVRPGRPEHAGASRLAWPSRLVCWSFTRSLQNKDGGGAFATRGLASPPGRAGAGQPWTRLPRGLRRGLSPEPPGASSRGPGAGGPLPAGPAGAAWARRPGGGEEGSRETRGEERAASGSACILLLSRPLHPESAGLGRARCWAPDLS